MVAMVLDRGGPSVDGPLDDTSCLRFEPPVRNAVAQLIMSNSEMCEPITGQIWVDPSHRHRPPEGHACHTPSA